MTDAKHMSPSALPTTGRRKDIEGLRGLAIALVVAFHVWVGTVSGGVDVFLVISGFFLIPSLLRQVGKEEESLNPWPRVRKTVTRLWVPMALVIATATVIATVVYPATKIAQVTQDALSSTLWYVNWQFMNQSREYGSADDSASVFQHLWSMSVQAQIFILLIVAVLGLGLFVRSYVAPATAQKIMTWVLAATALASFIFATLYGILGDPSKNYYNTFSRAWEIILGGLVALIIAKIPYHRISAEIVGIIGLALLLVTGIILDGSSQFPGPWALVPVFAGLAIIYAGSVNGSGSLVSRMLLTAPFQKVGELAYHLYLWHWPILILFLGYKQYNAHLGTASDKVSVMEGAGVIGISLVVAAVSHWLVPNGKPRKNIAQSIGSFMMPITSGLVIVSICIMSVVNVNAEDDTEETPDSYPGASSLVAGAVSPSGIPVKPSVYRVGADKTYTYDNGCFTPSENEDFSECVSGDVDSPRTIAVVGGSHSDHYLPALDDIATRKGFKIVSILKAGCPLEWSPEMTNSLVDGVAAENPCDNWRVRVFDRLEEMNPDYVFTTSTRPVLDGEGDFVPEPYVTGFQLLEDAGIKVIGVRDTPWMRDDRGNRTSPQDCIAQGKGSDECGAPREIVLSPVNPSEEAYAGLTNVSLMDFSNMVCSEEVCPAVVGNIFVYRDGDHLSTPFMRSMTPYIESELGRVTGWW